jgi:RimJ/RimL family protein N-acetyltransferase
MRHFPSTLTEQQSNEMIDRMRAVWAERGFGLWAVERTDTAELVGFVGLSAPAWQSSFTPCVEVGWRLARRHWGNGFAPEAATAALQFGFDNVELPHDEIVSFTTVANSNSRRVMEKIGMVHDPARDFDHPLLPTWPERRHVLYRIDRRQFADHVAR